MDKLIRLRIEAESNMATAIAEVQRYANESKSSFAELKKSIDVARLADLSYQQQIEGRIEKNIEKITQLIAKQNALGNAIDEIPKKEKAATDLVLARKELLIDKIDAINKKYGDLGARTEAEQQRWDRALKQTDLELQKVEARLEAIPKKSIAETARLENQYQTLSNQIKATALSIGTAETQLDKLGIAAKKAEGLLGQMRIEIDRIKDQKAFAKTEEEVHQLNIELDRAEKNYKAIDTAGREVNTTFAKSNSVLGDLRSTLIAAFGVYEIYEYSKALLANEVQYEALEHSIMAISKSQAEYYENLTFLTQLSETYGQNLLKLGDSYKNFIASSDNTNLSLKERQRIYESIIKASTALRLSDEKVEDSLRALGQMFSKGTVQAEELKGQLGEALPGAYGLAAKAMNMTTAELGKQLKEGKVLAEDMLPKLATQLERLYNKSSLENAASLSAEWNRLKNAVLLGVDGFNKANGVTDKLATGLRYLRENASDLLAMVKTLTAGYVAYNVAVYASEVRIKALMLLENAQKIIKGQMILVNLQLGASYELLTVAETEAAVAARAFNASLGPIAVTLAVLTAAYFYFREEQTKTKEGTLEYIKVNDEEIKSLHKTALGMDNQIRSIASLKEGTDERTMAIQKLIATYPQYFANVDAEKVTNDQLRIIYNQVNKSIERKIELLAAEKFEQAKLDASVDVRQKLLQLQLEDNDLKKVGVFNLKELEKAEMAYQSTQAKSTTFGGSGLMKSKYAEAITLLKEYHATEKEATLAQNQHLDTVEKQYQQGLLGLKKQFRNGILKDQAAFDKADLALKVELGLASARVETTNVGAGVATVAAGEKKKQAVKKTTTELALENDVMILKSTEKTYNQQIDVIKKQADLEIEQARRSLAGRVDFAKEFAAKKAAILLDSEQKQEKIYAEYREKQRISEEKQAEELWKFKKDYFEKQQKVEAEFAKLRKVLADGELILEADRNYRRLLLSAKNEEDRLQIDKDYNRQILILAVQRYDFEIAREQARLLYLKNNRFATVAEVQDAEKKILELQADRVKAVNDLEENQFKTDLERKQRKEQIDKEFLGRMKAQFAETFQFIAGENFKNLGAMGGDFINFGENVKKLFKDVKDGALSSNEAIQKGVSMGLQVMSKAYSAYSQDKHDKNVKDLQDGLDAFNKAKDEELKGLEEKSKAEIELLSEKLRIGTELNNASNAAKIQEIESTYKVEADRIAASKKDALDAYNYKIGLTMSEYEKKKELAIQAYHDEVDVQAKNIEQLDTLRNGLLNRWIERQLKIIESDRQSALLQAANAQESANINLFYDNLVKEKHNEYEQAKLDKNSAVKLATEELRLEEKETSIRLKNEEKTSLTTTEEKYKNKIVELATERDLTLAGFRKEFEASEKKSKDDLQAANKIHNEALAEQKKTYTDAAAVMEKGLKDKIVALENQLKDDKSRIENEKATKEREIKLATLTEDYEMKKAQLWMNYVSAVASAFGINPIFGIAFAIIAGAYFAKMQGDLTSAYNRQYASISGAGITLPPTNLGIPDKPKEKDGTAVGNTISSDFTEAKSIVKDKSTDPQFADAPNVPNADGHETPMGIAEMKDGSQSNFYETYTDFATGKPIKFVRTVAKFEKGTPYLDGFGYPAGVDTIPIWANRGERIMPTKDNEAIGKGTTNSQLVEAWQFYNNDNIRALRESSVLNIKPLNMTPITTQSINSNFDMDGTHKRLERLEGAIMAQTKALMGKPAVTVSHDGYNQTEIFETENYRKITRRKYAA